MGGYLLDTQQDARKRKKFVWLLAIIGLLPLLTFKYYNFINESISQGLETIGLKFALPGLNWAIPVGISFFSFQAVGYMLDVYHKRIEPERNLANYILFVSFFPQIASGPISKASELIPQFKVLPKFNYEQAVCGLRYLLWGMYLKVVLADRIGIYVDTVFNNYHSFDAFGCGAASVLYSIQIYCDFSGYSLMAIGLAKTLGFNLINNFNRPYFSTSISEFWRRWHISLSRWLKEQIYIPLGGSRCSRVQSYYNILITFLVSGIWHGANWTFIIWGILHGICQVVEKDFGWNLSDYKGVKRIFRIIVTFGLVTIAWIIFRCPSIEYAVNFFGQFLTLSGSYLSDSLDYIIIALIPLLIFEISKEFLPGIYSKVSSIKSIRWLSYVVIFLMIILMGVHDGSSFIYVSF